MVLQEKFEDAIAMLNKAPGDADNADALGVLSQAFLGAERYEEAKESATRLVALAPERGEAHTLLGWALLKVDEPSRALDAFSEARARSPELVQALAGKACALIRLGHDSEANRIIERINQLDPDYLVNEPVVTELSRSRRLAPRRD